MVTMPGNGRTPPVGVPQLPMPVSPSRAYQQRRKTDKPVYKVARAIPVILGVITTLASGAWWLAEKTVVTRDEWSEAEIKAARFQGEVKQELAQSRADRESQAHLLKEVRESQERIETKLANRPRR